MQESLRRLASQKQPCDNSATLRLLAVVSCLPELTVLVLCLLLLSYEAAGYRRWRVFEYTRLHLHTGEWSGHDRLSTSTGPPQRHCKDANARVIYTKSPRSFNGGDEANRVREQKRSHRRASFAPTHNTPTNHQSILHIIEIHNHTRQGGFIKAEKRRREASRQNRGKTRDPPGQRT